MLLFIALVFLIAGHWPVALGFVVAHLILFGGERD